MLKGIPEIIPPELLRVLAEMGHTDELTIGDGNFPGHTDVYKRQPPHLRKTVTQHTPSAPYCSLRASCLAARIFAHGRPTGGMVTCGGCAAPDYQPDSVFCARHRDDYIACSAFLQVRRHCGLNAMLHVNPIGAL